MNIEHKHWTMAEGRIPPRATDYASTIESDVPIVVQHPGLVPEEPLKPFTVTEMNDCLISSNANK
jgi:hypothetical protein